MKHAGDIKSASERAIKAMALRRSVGTGTASTVVSLNGSGTACVIEDGPWKLECDLSTEQGGDGSAPDPGMFGRSALGACLVLGYELWAARLGVRLDDVRVTVESDYDARGMYGVTDDLSPGWQAVRCIIEVSSPDDPERVAEVVEKANRYSPLMADIARPVPVNCDVRISASKE